jgi:long-chain fatty acid transport protein
MKKSIMVCAVTAALVSAGNSMAGGLWVNDYGDFAGGRATAGAAAGTDDAATIAHNPATATRIEGSQLFTAAGAFLPTIKFDTQYSSPRNGFDNGKEAGVVAPTGSLSYIHDFGSDKWAGGVYFIGAAGAGLDYGTKWSGRYQATEVDLLIATLAPTVSYRLTDKLSIGASLQYWYADLNLKLEVPRLNTNRPDGRASVNGDDTGFGFTLGAMYELTERTRFGINYQSELQPDFSGEAKLRFPDGLPPAQEGSSVSSDTELNMAQYVRVGMHHDMNEKWAVDFTVGWDDWSQLGNVLLSTERRNIDIPAKWRDTYHYAWGTQYRLDKYWTLTTGVSYDTNPVSAANRNAQLPVDRQVRVAFGARYDVKETLSVGGYLNYTDLGKARIEANNFGGKYKDNNVLQVMVNANWTF